MFRLSIFFTWAGIILISGLFLIGQDAWQTCTDNDGDGYGDPGSSLCPSFEWDCDDSNDQVNPGALEVSYEAPVCHDSLDNDCDGYIDTQDEGCCLCNDQDDDGYGSPGCRDCLYPEKDCNDGNAQVNPARPETAANEIDDDCDGWIDEPSDFFGRIRIDLSMEEGPAVTITDDIDPEKIIWQTIPGESFISAALAEETIIQNGGAFTVTDNEQNLCDRQRIDEIITTAQGVSVSGRLSGIDCDVGFLLDFIPLAANQLGFDLKLTGPDSGYNRLYLRYASSPGERFFGFGEQFGLLDLKGQKVTIISKEGGVGRWDDKVITGPMTGEDIFSWFISLLVNIGFPGGAGNWQSAYAPAPYYLTSKGRSLFLENDEISVFDMETPEEVSIKLFGNHMRGRILAGDSPLELIEEYTSYTGRMPRLPDWLNEGAVVGLKGGTDQVYDKLTALQAHQVPVAAFWMEDWMGPRTTFAGTQLWYNWELDEDHYHGWDELIQTLGDSGIRVMTYMNTMLVDVAENPAFERNLFLEAQGLGYLVKNQAGETYRVPHTGFDMALVDFTNPAACQWFKEVIKDNLLGIGISGWMADYGEYLPFDAQLHSGEDARAVHNRYPEMWARLNREVLEEEGLLGEVVFFSRSGSARSPGLSTLFWGGDQMVTFDRHDGLKSVIRGMLSGGLSGISLNHSDTGGHTSLVLDLGEAVIPALTRTKEVLLRWMEMSAFTPVYRTHEGNRPVESVQFYEDEDTLNHFARCAKIFRALAFYRSELMEEAAKKGYPLMRHPLLEYPNDPNVYDLLYQWMLGTEFMVAPVVDAGMNTVDAYLPAGRWVHLWSGEVTDTTEAGRWITDIPAPIGEPAIFYKSGSAAAETFLANLVAEGIL